MNSSWRFLGTIADDLGHDHEAQAFRNFITVRGRCTGLLIDTYDTERAAHRVAELAYELKESKAPGQVQGVRIDSGDLGARPRAVRRILDAQQCQDIEIILSGSLDEHRIESLLEADTPVDALPARCQLASGR